MEIQILINGINDEGKTINENFDDVDEALYFLENLKEQNKSENN